MLPELFVERMQKMLGDEFEAFIGGLSRENYQALRMNELKTGADGENAASEAVVRRMPFHLTNVLWAKNGYYYEKEDMPGKHPYHEAGLYYIQEPSAMAPVTLLHPKPGERILDLCAAPGGKSTQIAAAMEGKGLLVSNEIHPARARILSENIERMGVRNACVTNETPKRLAEAFPDYFDRILVDAPCSGEGMFRKNEAVCEEWSPENVLLCAKRQDDILDCAAGMLRPGGRLVYSTCTFAPEENEGSISRFLERHPDFVLVPVPGEVLGICDTSAESLREREGQISGERREILDRNTAEFVKDAAPGIENTLRLWPHLVKGEGHFAAVLTRKTEYGSNDDNVTNGIFDQLSGTPCLVSPAGIQKGVTEKELGEYPAFAHKFLCGKLQGNYLRFGDNLYLLPENMPSVTGLKVLRPGLHLGTLKQNRFEPSHALALALSPEEVSLVWNLAADDNVINAYLAGETFPAAGEKGWYLICVDGFSIGWGKLAGGIMKNHYPKGLRKNLRQK